MHLCLPIARRPLSRVLRTTGVRSVGSSASTPSAPPSRSASNADPEQFNRTPEEIRLMSHTGDESQYKLGKHRSNAMELVNKVPVIEVDGEMAVCDGGGGGLGHPYEYISLARPGSVNACKYCQLRFTQKAH